MEEESGCKLPFLDILVTKKDDRLLIPVYQKPRQAWRHLDNSLVQADHLVGILVQPIQNIDGGRYDWAPTDWTITAIICHTCCMNCLSLSFVLCCLVANSKCLFSISGDSAFFFAWSVKTLATKVYSDSSAFSSLVILLLLFFGSKDFGSASFPVQVLHRPVIRGSN